MLTRMHCKSRSRTLFIGLLFTFLAYALQAAAQSQIIDASVHSPGLEGNLLGDPADQPVAIYLPDAYGKQPQDRFPVVYFLHGYSDATPRHQAAESFRKALDDLIAKGAAKPMIVVLPNGLNKYRGSFYVNSSTTGKWEDFIVHDVVEYVDKNYRTLATADRRGIAGHSMGGFGALSIAFRHPEVFSVVYAMSPCCTDLVGDLGPSNRAWPQISTLQSAEEVPRALTQGQFFVAANTALMAALAPDPAAKTFGDSPYVFSGGSLKTDATAFSRIAANMPANMVFPYLAKISLLRGIFIEYGAQENFTHIIIGAQELSSRLSQAGISNTLEVFQGDHGNHFLERVGEHMLPWMSKHLSP
ncbi:MAG: prolyl oligopeptidase family serine peptidase [Acidobacteria bacterium]|nr:prolyl oligopeptidase family serine peptidase [Acidobacteriota bacterium]